MTQRIWIGLLLAALTPLGANARALHTTQAKPKIENLSRAELLKGCPVPEHREFPVNPAINACENFYEYACSKVNESFTLPADRPAWTYSFSDNAERLLYAKKNFFRALEAGYVPKTTEARQVRPFYMACMNEQAAAAEERQRIASEKATIMNLKTADDFADLLQKRIDTGEETFLGFDDTPNLANPNINDVSLEAEVSTLPERSYYEKPELMADFEALVTEFFRTVGVDQPELRAQWVVTFEREMAEKVPLPSEMRQRRTQDNTLAAADWVRAYPHLKLDRILAKFPAELKVRRMVPEAFEYLENAIAQKPVEQLKSVLLFHALSKVMDDAYPVYYQKKFELARKYLGGSEKRADRQERCTKEAMQDFGMEIDQELTPILFPNFPAEKVVKLVERTRTSIVEILDRNTYLSPEAKTEAKRKISSASLFLVQPRTEDDWNFRYAANYDEAKPLANRLLFTRKVIEKTETELGQPRHRSRWLMGPLTLNAYYVPNDNKFTLLQGILQYPFFDPNGDDLDNIGAIGSVTGHELGHSIDDQGSQYDADGRVRPWMRGADAEEFHRRSEKFVALFNSIGHDGKLTLGENIGDHVGITAAYNAAFPMGTKAEPARQQRFFLGWAHAWCNTALPTYQEQQLKTDPHSLGWARVNEQVIQLPGFAQAFSCKAGDKMYVAPEDQIRVW